MAPARPSPADPAPRARDALGMPVPPPAAVRGATRVRNAVGRAHDAMAPPFQLVLERMFGLLDAKALAAAVTLGLPEQLAGGPRTAVQLAESLGADADAVERLLRYLVSRGIFRVRRDGRFANNGASEVLREDHPYSWRGWVEFMGSDWNSAIFDHLAERVRTGEEATRLAFGDPFFAYVNEKNPAAGAAFNEAMAAGSRVQSLLFAEAIAFEKVTTICDVGGGTGSALAGILRQHPHLQGVVFDLPALAAEAGALLASAGIADRATFVGGDFFSAVPHGQDVYSLFAVVHDWDDDAVVRILQTIRDALTPSGRVMVIERPIQPGDGPDFSRASDLLMLVLGDGGRERTRAQYEALFARAGLHLESVTTLPSLFQVFTLQLPA